MRIPIRLSVSAKTRSGNKADRDPDLRIGIPRILNQWATPRFWTAFFEALGVKPTDSELHDALEICPIQLPSTAQAPLPSPQLAKYWSEALVSFAALHCSGLM